MRLAIVKLSALGDIVHAMVGLQFIKMRFPGIIIDWIVEERYAGVLQHNPDIDNILTVNLKALKADKMGVFQEIKNLRQYAANRYNLVIDAQGLLKSALTARLLGKKVAGFDANSIRERAASWFYQVKVAKPYHDNTVDRNLSVLSNPLGFTIASDELFNKKPFLHYDPANVQFDVRHYFPKGGKKNIMLVIGSTWETRNYPPEKFVKIAQALNENCLVIWGNAQEKSKAEWMAEQCGSIKVMPTLDLNSLKAAISMSDLLIGNDTGPTHMAWALNRPSITIFGPTPVSRIHQTEINKAVKSHSVVNPYKLNKQDDSIRDIDEHTIIEQAKFLLTDRQKQATITS